MEQIVRRGRVRGFRPWLITQRPAELHKSVLSQAATLVAMQLTAPQDRDAIGAWIEGQADRDQGKRVLAELPRLGQGEGYVWAPMQDVLARVRFPKLKTFDSGRTPDEQAQPIQLPEVNLAEFKALFADVQAEAERDDPAVLRKRISELERSAHTLAKTDPRMLMEQAHSAGYSSATDAMRARAGPLIFAAQQQIQELARVLSGTTPAPAPRPPPAPRAPPDPGIT